MADVPVGPKSIDAANPVDKPTELSKGNMAEIYHMGGKMDATVIPHGHYKTAYVRNMNWTATLDDKTEVSREVLEFMKKANKLVNGKLLYGHVVSYKEAAEMVKNMEAPKAAAAAVVAAAQPQALAQQAAQALAASAAAPLAPTPAPAVVAQNTPLPVQSKVDVTFSGPFGKLKVRYDEVFVQGINLVLAQRTGADYEPPNTGDQPIGIETLGKRFICYTGTRIAWPDGSLTIDLFLIEGTAP